MTGPRPCACVSAGPHRERGGVAPLIGWAALSAWRSDMHRTALLSPLLQALAWLMSGFLVVLGTMTTASARADDVLPFVEPGGLLRAGLTRSMVEAQFGPPPVTRERYEAGDRAMNGALVFEYPDLGLNFVVPPVERDEADPRIAFLVVKPPSAMRTPEGLGLGMHWNEVRARAQGGQFEGKGGRIEWSRSPGAGARKASFVISTDNVVLYLSFDAGIPHQPAYKRWIERARWLLAVVLVFVFVLLLPWLYKGYPERVMRRIEAWAPMRARLGKSMLILAPVLVILGIPLAREGGPIGLLGMLMILGGALLLLPAAFNLALGGRLTPGRLVALGLVGLAVLILRRNMLRLARQIDCSR